MKYLYLKSHPLFADLPEEKLAEIAGQARVKTARRGEHLDYGDGAFTRIYLLINGKIKLTDIDEGDNEIVKDILTAPDIFGDLSLGQVHSTDDEYAQVLTGNTIVCYFLAGDFRRLLEANPAIAINYANRVNAKLRKLEIRHSDLVFRDAKSRLIRFIKSWAKADGSTIGDKIVLNNYLTHSDIASVIATSRQSVNMLLNELRDAGLLLYNRKHIELHNPLSWN
ncbi:MAG TPA: Crp/Fnr family transcriptional regulator [Puia sp.]|nr:Crp/Fnr family transcriptional regulator [Puia sp.]